MHSPWLGLFDFFCFARLSNFEGRSGEKFAIIGMIKGMGVMRGYEIIYVIFIDKK